jgi:hypothetical protein
MIIELSNNNVKLVAETFVRRIYGNINVSDLTLSQVDELIDKEDIEYSGDYGFKVQDNVQLIFSKN